MSGFTANLSNLPPGTTVADIERHFGERTHRGDCPSHPDSDWSPGEELALAARALVLNARVSDIEGYRVQRGDFEELRAVVASVWRYQPSKAVTYQGNILPAPIVDATNERRRVFFWPHDGMTVTVDRLRVTGDGIYCWITVSMVEHGDIYGPVRIDLLSDTKRNAFRLAMRERKEHDWLGVIQHVAKLTIESLDPASDLVDMATYEP